MANVPNDQEVLGGIREELAAIKVPGAEEAAPESTWNDLDEVEGVDVEIVPRALRGCVLGARHLDGGELLADAFEHVLIVGDIGHGFVPPGLFLVSR